NAARFRSPRAGAVCHVSRATLARSAHRQSIRTVLIDVAPRRHARRVAQSAPHAHTAGPCAGGRQVGNPAQTRSVEYQRTGAVSGPRWLESVADAVLLAETDRQGAIARVCGLGRAYGSSLMALSPESA